jgi:hypothetical protein
MEDVIWGFSEKYGWIMLDRTIERNRVGKKKGLMFVCCRDLTLFEIDWNEWLSPLYFLAEKYIESLNSDSSKQTVVNAEFDAIKARESEFRDLYNCIKEEDEKRRTEAIKEKRIKLEKRHRAFLEARNINYHGSSVVLLSEKPRRITHCYNCKGSLDSKNDLGCNACKWILCDCGACGCGYNE